MIAKSVSDDIFNFSAAFSNIFFKIHNLICSQSVDKKVRKWAYPFIRFLRDKKVWFCFPQNRHPQISQIATASLWPTMSWPKGCPAGKVEEIICALVM